MPSPFPGMDPYLEDPALWPDVHASFINVARELLVAHLRPKYFVQVDERVYLSDHSDEAHGLIVPDPGIELAYGWELEVHEAYLRILDKESREVVTVIEVLSPANKVKGSSGRRNYDDKRNDVLSTRTSLVEIDLLREGMTLAESAKIPPHEYMVQSWRFVGDTRKRHVWPMSMRHPLQTIPIPLRPNDADASLDLQAVLNTAYDRAGYDLTIDYTKPPTPPLVGETAEWARDIIQRVSLS